jgi:hypothetical protein
MQKSIPLCEFISDSLNFLNAEDIIVLEELVSKNNVKILLVVHLIIHSKLLFNKEISQKCKA